MILCETKNVKTCTYYQQLYLSYSKIHAFRPKDVEDSVQATYYVSLHDMLPKCDFVVLSCALTSETTGIIGEKELSLMKPTASLINVARGNSSYNTHLHLFN